MTDYERGFRDGVEAAAKECEEVGSTLLAVRIRHIAPPTPEPATRRERCPDCLDVFPVGSIHLCPSPAPAPGPSPEPATRWRKGWSIPPSPTPEPATRQCVNHLHQLGQDGAPFPCPACAPAPGPETKP